MEADAELEDVAGGVALGRRLRRCSGCRGVAFCQLSDDARGGQPFLRHDLFRLQLSLMGGRSVAAFLECPAGDCALPRTGHRRSLRLDQHLDRAWLWRLDAEGPALKALRALLLLLVCGPQVALAHVG